jgi:hypothetical protein
MKWEQQKLTKVTLSSLSVVILRQMCETGT